MTRRILVTGSRTWTDADVILAALREHAAGATDVVVVHGGAAGADRLADQIARERGARVERHPADWARHGRAAGFLRNQKMVRLGADVCLAFIHNASRGATACADTAQAAGIPTYRYETGEKP